MSFSGKYSALNNVLNINVMLITDAGWLSVAAVFIC
jgi:hypothetical protein